MNIHTLMIKPGPAVFYTKAFMDVLEAHRAYFRSAQSTHIVQVDPKRAAIYEGDLYGYLNEVGIEAQYHWFIMRLSGLTASTEFTQAITELYIPSRDEINQILIAYKATGVINV